MLQLFTTVRTFVFDIDGVLTDGRLLITEAGDMLRQMNIRDGYALQLAVKKGYNVWVLSGGQSEGVRIRLNKLGISVIHLGVENKKETLIALAAASGVAFSEVLYMGDDMPDLAAMQLCALPCCPADAIHEVKQISKYISPTMGGYGCVRDVVAKVLKLNGHWAP